MSSLKSTTEYTFYLITFPNNTVYLGQTKKHEYMRWGQHISECREGKHPNKIIQGIYNKYTTKEKTSNNYWVTKCGARDWKFEVIHKESTPYKEFANEIEKRWIKKLVNEGKQVVNIRSTIVGDDIPKHLRVDDKNCKAFL